MLVTITDSDYPNNDAEQEVISKAGGTMATCQCKTEQDVIQQCADADGLLVQYAPITEKVVLGLPQCKVIVRYGVGVDCVDLDAAAAAGIVVANVPDYCMHEVAEHVLAFIFALGRKLVASDRDIRNGGWGHGNIQPVYRISGSTLGLVGFGNIARKLAEKALGIGLKVLASDPYVSRDEMSAAGARSVELEELLKRSDFVSLHAPATPETTNMINAERLGLMKPTAILINAARGALVDEAALADALKQGTIAGAGIDTPASDPVDPDSPLLELPNAIVSGHIGWYSEDSLDELVRKTAKAAVTVLQGEEPKSWVNRKAMDAAGVTPRFRS